MADFNASPKLRAEFQDWTRHQLDKASPAPQPQPQTNWLSQLGAAVSCAVAGWSLPSLGDIGEGLAGLIRLLRMGSGGERT